MTEPKFKVGDRVRERGTSDRGVIKSISKSGVLVEWDDPTYGGLEIDAECLIRLKPRAKRREFWLGVNALTTYVHNSLESANKPESALGRRELIHVREVRKKEGGK